MTDKPHSSNSNHLTISTQARDCHSATFDENMKYLITFCLLSILSHLGWGGELAPFKVTPEQEIGKSRAFELSKGYRSVIKAPLGAFLVLELIESGQDRNQKTSAEFCSLAWTYIGVDGTSSGTERCFIRYSCNEGENGGIQVTRIGGSESISIKGVNLEWSYSTSDMVFIYPESGTQYSLTKVEPAGADQPATRSADKVPAKIQPSTPTSKDGPR